MRNSIYFALAFIGLLQFSAQAQWEEIGLFEGGSNVGFGNSVAMNGSGSKIVVGTANLNDASAYVDIYTQIENDWVLYGNRIEFDESTGTSSFSGRPLEVDISADGNTIVIGDRGYEVGQFFGRTLVYKYENGNWNLDFEVKSIPVNTFGINRFGDCVSISNDGNRIAIANPNYNRSKGRVVTYEFDGFNWIELGNALTGQFDFAQLGWRMDLSGNGNVLAVFEVGNQVADGVIKIFKLENNTWVQEGVSIPVSTPSNVAANAQIEFNFNGDVLILGNGNDDQNGDDSGVVKVYQNNNGNWQILGQTIVGSSSLSNLGAAVSINDVGNIIAFMSSFDLSNLSSFYSVHIFENNQWNLIDNIFGTNIDGIAISMGMNDSGNRLVVGEKSILGPNGASIFKNDNLLSNGLETAIDPTIHPNPSEGYFKIEGLDFHLIESIQLFDLSGRLVKAFSIQGSNGVFNMSDLQSGSYLVKIESSSGAAFKQLIKK